MNCIREQLEDENRYEMMTRAFEEEEGYQYSYLLDVKDKEGETLYLIIVDIFYDRIAPSVAMEGPDGYTKVFDLDGIETLAALEETSMSLWLAMHGGSTSSIC